MRKRSWNRKGELSGNPAEDSTTLFWVLFGLAAALGLIAVFALKGSAWIDFIKSVLGWR